MDRKVMVYKESQSLWIKENYNNIHETSLSAVKLCHHPSLPSS